MIIEPTELKQARDRIMRARGQLLGIVKMIDEGRDCTELLNQLAAANRALDKAGFAIISKGMSKCSEANADPAERKALEKAFLTLA